MGGQKERKGKDFLKKLKTKLKKAVVWINENKDKTLDEILVEGWKEKCSKSNLQCRSKGPKRRKMSKQAKTSSSNCRKSQSEKKKRCVEAGLVDKNDDSSEAKEVKDGLRNLLEEDSDEVFEFLDSYSSRTFNDIENEDSPNEETKPSTGSESSSSS